MSQLNFSLPRTKQNPKSRAKTYDHHLVDRIKLPPLFKHILTTLGMHVVMTGGGVSSNPKLGPVYFSGSNDNPGYLVTLIQLKDGNFNEWSRAIRISSTAKRKLGFINGTIPKPITVDADWSIIYSMLVLWLLNTISLNLCATMSFF